MFRFDRVASAPIFDGSSMHGFALQFVIGVKYGICSSHVSAGRTFVDVSDATRGSFPLALTSRLKKDDFPDTECKKSMPINSSLAVSLRWMVLFI